MAEQNPYVEELTFASDDEMIAYMEKQRAEINARPLHEDQLGIGWGDYAVRFYKDLVIFVQVETVDSLAAEDVETRLAIEERFAANSLWCKCFSRIVPQGEYGYLHRSVLWPINARCFSDAWAGEFNLDKMTDMGRFQLEAAYQCLRAHTEGS